MSSIGETLRRERVRRNLELDQVSQELKISSRFLDAIEDERFDRLPAAIFAKSFVRQYAELLELDADELVAEVERTLAPAAPTQTSEMQPQVPRVSLPEIHLPRVEAWEAVGDRRGWSSSLPALALVVLVMLVCSGVYAFWQRSRHPATARQAPPQVEAARPPAAAQPAAAPPAATPPVPAPAQAQANVAAPGQADASSAAKSAAPPANPSAAAANSADRPAPDTEAPPVKTAAAANTSVQPANQPAANAQAGQPPANPNAKIHIQLTAAEPVWVLARANGKYLFSGTIDANQTRSVDANGTLLLRIGNAGGVSITLNGKPIGTVGAKGQVRDVQFTSGGFQIVAVPKPPSLPL